MTNEEMFQVLRPIVELVTGVPTCILADQNQLAPKGPYATIRPRQFISERGQANIYTRDIPDNKVETDVRSQIIAVCSVNFFRGEAAMWAEQLKECHKRPDVMVMLCKAKIGWGGNDPVNNLTSLQSSNWEQRAQIGIRLWYETQDISTINNILSATATFEDQHARTFQEIHVP